MYPQDVFVRLQHHMIKMLRGIVVLIVLFAYGNSTATDNDELDIGISAVSAPIFDHRGNAIAAIVILTPTARFADDPESKPVLALRAACEAISDKFFYKDGQQTSTLDS